MKFQVSSKVNETFAEKKVLFVPQEFFSFFWWGMYLNGSQDNYNLTLLVLKKKYKKK
jgi:hypothetical protein